MSIDRLMTRLESLRVRVKKLYFIQGCLQILLRALALIVVLFLVDYGIDPPRGARIILSVLALGYLCYAFYRYLLYPLKKAPSREDIAKALERKYPTLDGDLLSAVHFHSLKKDSRWILSASLLEAALVQVVRKAEQVPWKRFLETGRFKKLAALTFACFFLVSGYAIIRPDLASIWSNRMLGGSSAWPRSTTLFILLDSEAENYKLLSEADPSGAQQVLMARGSSLPVRVKVEGRDPREVEIVQEAPENGRFVTQMTRRSDGEYRYRFRNVREGMRFWVYGGDDDGRGRYVDVRVEVPPEVQSTQVQYHYPEYLSMADEVRESSQIEGPEGTRVHARFQVTRPIQSGAIRLRTDAGEERISLQPQSESPLLLSHDLILEKSGTYRIELTGVESFANVDAPLHSIIVRKDALPRVKLFAPRRSELDLCPRAVVVFRCAGEDDHGIAALRLKTKSAGEETFEIHEFTAEEMDASYGSPLIVAGHVLDLDRADFKSGEGRRKLGRGDALLYTVEAEDFRPDRETGRENTGIHAINIVSENEKIRILTQRQIRLKEDIRTLRNLQDERLVKTRDLLDSDEDSSPGRELVALQVGQNKVTNRLRSASQELAGIFDDYLFNRLDRTPAAAVLLDRATSLHMETKAQEGFSPARYEALIDFYLSGQLGEMDLMERLLTMLALSLQVSEKQSPAAAEALAQGMLAVGSGTLGSGTLGSGAWVTPLQESVRQQEDVLATLDLLLEKMDEWEDYQELLQLFRDVIDSQNNLNILTREELKNAR